MVTLQAEPSKGIKRPVDPCCGNWGTTCKIFSLVFSIIFSISKLTCFVLSGSCIYQCKMDRVPFIKTFNLVGNSNRHAVKTIEQGLALQTISLQNNTNNIQFLILGGEKLFAEESMFF